MMIFELAAVALSLNLSGMKQLLAASSDIRMLVACRHWLVAHGTRGVWNSQRLEPKQEPMLTTRY